MSLRQLQPGEKVRWLLTGQHVLTAKVVRQIEDDLGDEVQILPEKLSERILERYEVFAMDETDRLIAKLRDIARAAAWEVDRLEKVTTNAT